MNCPRCKDPQLSASRLESGMGTQACDACDGHWIESVHYWAWLDSLDTKLPEIVPEAGTALEICDHEEALVCPECKRILVRCRVGHGLHFYLDRCTHCGGIWLDAHEWEALKLRNLHDDIHFIFSKSWQDRNLQEERALSRERWLLHQFGEAGFARMNEFRDWIRGQEQRSAIIRFLSDDPQ